MEVECIEGYTLVGNNTLTCGKQFDYTARVLPECVPIAGCETPIIGIPMLHCFIITILLIFSMLKNLVKWIR